MGQLPVITAVWTLMGRDPPPPFYRPVLTDPVPVLLLMLTAWDSQVEEEVDEF